MLIWALIYLFEEFIQYQTEIRLKSLNYWDTAFDHLTDIWNVLDVIALVGSSTESVSILINAEAFGRGSLAVASVAQCFKILYFLRAFESTGPLVSMIFNILFDVRYFFLILGLILSGFSQAFWLISFGDEISDFGTMAKSLLNIFRYDGRS